MLTRMLRTQGARNGLVYGAKIRFPHALVMTFLFGRGTVQERLMFVYRATKQHALNLFKFVSLYKAITIFLRNTNGGKPRSIDSFIGGLAGGWVVFGERNAVNEQVSGSSRHFEEGAPRQEALSLTSQLRCNRSYCTAQRESCRRFFRDNKYRPTGRHPSRFLQTRRCSSTLRPSPGRWSCGTLPTDGNRSKTDSSTAWTVGVGRR